MIKSVVVLSLTIAASSLLGAQTTPTPQQVQTAIAARPELATALRSRIQSSGLTPDQIRSRLKSAGYSETLLDAYLPGTVDTTAAPNEDVMRAVRFLGLVDAAEQDSLSRIAGSVVTPPQPVDTSTRVTVPNRIFGLDVFRRSTSQFEPDLAGPVDPSYKIGPRDVIAVILTGGVENSYSLEVTREGFIVIPQVGQVYVSSLTLEQATDAIYRRLRTVYSGLGRGPGASTQLYVTVARLRANQIFVLGEVERPGSYQISSAGTALTALYAAAGPSDNGSLRSVQVRRNGRPIGSLDVYTYLVNGDASRDSRLENGDVVFVPVRGARVEITGAVIRPAIYEIQPDETLADLIHFAGGFSPTAEQQRLLVHRILPRDLRGAGGRDRTVLDVDPSDSVALRFKMLDGDRVEVLSISSKIRNQIVVTGAVWTPGTQGIKGPTPLSTALRLAGGVKPDAKDVQISRLNADQSRSELRTTFIDTLGTPQRDVIVQEDDSIVVFGVSDFRPDRYVAVTGAVRNGGRFPYREGMSLRDLLHYAGGLDDGAFLGYAEIARLPKDRAAGSLAVTIRVPLDSSYLLERAIDGTYQGPPGLPASPPTTSSPELEPYDNVLFLRQPDWLLDRAVVIRGEVKFPGRYTLATKTDRLTDLIARAGGLTNVAFAEGAVFVRQEGNIGRIALDLQHVIEDERYRDNIVLLNGDSLYIPPRRFVVDVRGAVHSPIGVAYSPGKDIEYYIRAAGGSTYEADDARAYVQQPSGIVQPVRTRALLPDSHPIPLPGSVVYVPKRDPEQKKDWAAITGSVAQILASFIALVAIARR